MVVAAVVVVLEFRAQNKKRKTADRPRESKSRAYVLSRSEMIASHACSPIVLAVVWGVARDRVMRPAVKAGDPVFRMPRVVVGQAGAKHN